MIWYPLGDGMMMDWIYPLMPQPMSRTERAMAWGVEHYGALLRRLRHG